MKAKYVEYGGKLAIVCAVAMLGVAGTWVMARERIEAGKKAAFQGAIKEVLGLPADAADPESMNPDDPQADQVFFATIDGAKRYATQGSHPGFSGPVVLAVGAEMKEGDLVIIEARVIAQTETPGLGTRIEEQETNLTLWTAVGNALGGDEEETSDWFFLKRFRGKGISKLEMTGDESQKASKILKITGVTVSTSAATLAVKKALQKILARISN